MICLRLELTLDCDYPGCGVLQLDPLDAFPPKQLMLDLFDVTGPVTKRKLINKAKKIGWFITGNTCFCPDCYRKHIEAIGGIGNADR